MTKIKIKCAGVPEHFNLPWRKAQEEDWFGALNVDFEWLDYGGGTGQMCKSLRSGEIDMAILLTEGAFKDLAEGNPSKICSFYVDSPLTWGVHTGAKSKLSPAHFPEKLDFAISRYTSGSHLMAYLYAKRKEISGDNIDFNVINNLEGAINSIRDNQDQLFLWEKYTTQPFVDSGDFKRIDLQPTPWPAFVVVATNKLLENHSDKVFEMLSIIQKQCSVIKNDSNSVQEIADRYRLEVSAVEKWMSELEWSSRIDIRLEVLAQVQQDLLSLNILKQPVDIESLVAFNSSLHQHI